MVYGLTAVLLVLAGWMAGIGWMFYPLALAACLHLLWQAVDVDIDDGGDCLAKFKSNRVFGWLFLAAIVAGRLLQSPTA